MTLAIVFVVLEFVYLMLPANPSACVLIMPTKTQPANVKVSYIGYAIAPRIVYVSSYW